MQYVKRLLLAVVSSLIPLSAVADDVQGGFLDQPARIQKFPVRVALVSPLRADDTSIQYVAGWPLTFRIIPRVDVSLVVPSVPGGPPSDWPELGATSFMMLKDLDSCPYGDGRITGPDGQPFCTAIPDDELYVEFTPDEDHPNTVDNYGYAEVGEALKDPLRQPTINYLDRVHTFGPRVYETLDGLGYGPNDDLPGFVLLANEGVGVVLSDLEPVFTNGTTVTAGWEPIGASRNLAGFMTSVGYELNDERLRTTVTTSLMVPRHLTERRFLEDQCFETAPGQCETFRRVEGGPPVPQADANLDDH
ncbi:MAG: hypothetical protein AAGC71_18005, partial [Pseudomonadota bacterium]